MISLLHYIFPMWAAEELILLRSMSLEPCKIRNIRFCILTIELEELTDTFYSGTSNSLVLHHLKSPENFSVLLKYDYISKNEISCKMEMQENRTGEHGNRVQRSDDVELCYCIFALLSCYNSINVSILYFTLLTKIMERETRVCFSFDRKAAISKRALHGNILFLSMCVFCLGFHFQY